MKLFSYGKDGGYESKVEGYWLIEIKKLFSIVLLKFCDGTRDAYHEHAFNAISWVLKGKLVEFMLKKGINYYKPSIWPIVTKRSTFHQVKSKGTTWVLSFRGPWKDTWREWIPGQSIDITLTHGRKQL